MEQLSVRLAAATKDVHDRAERSPFLAELLGGRLDRSAYAAMLAQHFYIYDALESAGDALQENDVVAPFLFPQLRRMPSLTADLEWLAGADWRTAHPALPSTIAYAARIRHTGDEWPAAYLAHHYTRYLGDLSGGRIIQTMLRRTFDFDEDGVRFYTFTGIEKPKVFKDNYRALLNAAPFDDMDVRRVTDEAIMAFDFNIAMFDELGDDHCPPLRPTAG